MIQTKVVWKSDSFNFMIQSSGSDFSREPFNTEEFVQRNFLRALTVCQSWPAGRIDKSSNTTHSVVKVT